MNKFVDFLIWFVVYTPFIMAYFFVMGLVVQDDELIRIYNYRWMDWVSAAILFGMVWWKMRQVAEGIYKAILNYWK